MSPVPPRYGLSSHYLGDAGSHYFQCQSREGALNGEIEAHKFSRWVRPENCVLDFGCAGGYLLRALRCARRLGVEPNPHARECAIALGVECYETLHEVPEQLADVAITNHVLEHVPFPIEALRQLKARVKPGGLVLICLPMEDWRVWREYDPGDLNHHLHTWNLQSLGNTLVEAGFTFRPADIKILTHAWPPRWHATLYRVLPLPLFDALCHVSARILRRRQLFAVVSV
jgi:SAM-dependent methyltransferase